MAQIPVCGTRMTRHHYTSYHRGTSRWKMGLMSYDCSWGSVRRLMLWITTTRLRYILHGRVATPNLYGYCSSMVQIPVCGTRMTRRRYISYRRTTCHWMLGLMSYDSSWCRVRRLMLWITSTRLRYI